MNILNMVYNLLFFSSKCSLFHNSNIFGSCIIHILYTGCAKILKNNSGAKKLNPSKLIPYLWSKPIVFPKLRALTLTRIQNSAGLFSSPDVNNIDVFNFIKCLGTEGAAMPGKSLNTWHVLSPLLTSPFALPLHEHVLLSSVRVIWRLLCRLYFALAFMKVFRFLRWLLVEW